MLALDIQRGGRKLSVELPMNTSILIGELRAIGIYEPLEQIHRHDFLLQPSNELGEHFMKMLKPDDTLGAIVTASQQFDFISDEPRRALAALIKADWLRDLNHMADYLKYGPDAVDGLMRLEHNGQSIILPTSPANMYELFGTGRSLDLIRLSETRLTSVSETGRQLIAEFQPYSDTIATANMACEMALLPDLRAPMKSVVAAARNIQVQIPTQEINFYCPLVARIEDEDSAYCKDASPEYLAWHEDEIRAALKDEIHEGENMADYIHDDALSQKITSAQWDIAKIGHTVYGKITCELRAPLTEDEQEDLIDWITGQNSDGLGEGWEQRPVQTDDGDLYVSLWHSEPGYYVLPEDEFQTQVLEQEFGGMGGMT